jgi:hypothetical protein
VVGTGGGRRRGWGWGWGRGGGEEGGDLSLLPHERRAAVAEAARRHCEGKTKERSLIFLSLRRVRGFGLWRGNGSREGAY